ncbi:hypothetical protein FJZ19_01930 [Candidatus Pacearchaeota archaeon]|nr:hypothetical protein [Candidatus Pacearchaeota archaeon]
MTATLDRTRNSVIDLRKEARLEQFVVGAIISGIANSKYPYGNSPEELVIGRYRFRRKEHVQTLRRDNNETITEIDYVLKMKKGRVIGVDVVSFSPGEKGVARDYDEQDLKLSRRGL